MFKFVLLITLTIVFNSAAILAQSGRVRVSESPTPSPTPKRATGEYNPTEKRTPSTSPTPPKGDDDDSVIKVDSTLVPIPVSVVDGRGAGVSNLRLQDFVLQIDGMPAEIGELTKSETPVRLALLFDNSSSATVAREFEKKAAIRFFRRVIRPEKDLVALYSVATVSRLEQRFTNNMSQLIGAIENFAEPLGATALLDGMIDAADYLRDATGRRVMVIVSDGDDTVSDANFDAVMKALLISNIQVYVVRTTDFENFQITGQRRGTANLRQLAAERRMLEFSGQTGGAVYSPIDEDELDAAFDQISAELAQQYVLSYYPEPQPEKRGDFRKISLTIKERPAYKVRTRSGYYVPRR
jgi:Ca-activated chloride channel family protein